MDSHKVSVTSENREGDRKVDVTATTNRVTFSFNWSHVVCNPQIELLAAGMWDISGLQPNAERPTIKVYRHSDGDERRIHLQIELPPSTTVDLLTQVISELTKCRAVAASE
jgi:hypothetical protein